MTNGVDNDNELGSTRSSKSQSKTDKPKYIDLSRDYEVGYGKPPVKSQFKKGVSGNPGGRPKHPTTFDECLNLELSKLVSVMENGKASRITKCSVIAKQYVNDTLSKIEKIYLHFLRHDARRVNLDLYLNPPPPSAMVPEAPTKPQSDAVREMKALIKTFIEDKIDNDERLDKEGG